MIRLIKKTLLCCFLLISLNSLAQEKIEINEEDYGNTNVEMADAMRENGKIYVVVAVICVIMAGILSYIIITDRKITRLEKELKE